MGITFIVLIGEHTHERPWVNYEIRSAYMQGKKIIGVYMHGCKDSVELPEAFKRYGGPIIGWNTTDKLADMIEEIVRHRKAKWDGCPTDI